MEDLNALKINLREEDLPFFTDSQLNFYLDQNGGDVRATTYQCLLIKAEDTSLRISGLSTSDTGKYFRRLASHYRPNNSGILRGVY